MKQVWVCDHCDRKIKEDEMETHEDECWHNPKFKLCNSCWQCEVDYGSFGYVTSCALGLDVMDHEAPEDGPCESWKQDE